ncbi:hypothetical protein ES705_50848 [subsurface metagenome]
MGFGRNSQFQRVKIMDVSKWPLEKIMALPDWCFGKRWWVGIYLGTAMAEAVPFIIDQSVPDVFVLWDVLVLSAGVTEQTRTDLTLRLCRALPTTANVREFQRLLRGFSEPTKYYEIQLPADVAVHIGPMRNLVEARNDKIGGIFKRLGASETGECRIWWPRYRHLCEQT